MKNLSKRFKFTLWVFGLMGQIAWVVENMYFNVFIYKMFHASAASISLMVSASAVTATVTTLIAGAVSDRAGRRKPFISGGYILWGLSILTFCLLRVDVLSAGGRSVAAAMSLGVNLTILMDCVMTVFGSTANDACFNAWLTESGDATNRGAIEGINAMMPLIAILVVFGGFMGFDLDKASSWVWIYGIIGVATILIGIAGIFTIEDTQPEKLQLNSFIRRVLFVFDRGTIWNHKLLYLIVGVFAIFGIAIQIFMPYLLLYYEIGLGMKNYVLIMAPAIIIASILSVVYGRLYDQLGFEKSAPIAVYILLAGFALLYLTRSTVPVFIGSMLMMTGDLCGMAAFGARIREETPQEQTGAFQGIRIFGQVLIPGVIGPAIGAAVLRNADKVVGSDGTESFIPNANIFLAAFLAGVLVLVALELLFRYVRVSHHNLSTRYAGVNIPTSDRIDDGELEWNPVTGKYNDYQKWQETYPRPQMVRENWISLDGKWDSGQVVPYPPEADHRPAARIPKQERRKLTDKILGIHRYQRTFSLPETNNTEKERILLHFGAVDQTCEVFVDGTKVGSHEGGYLPFALGITEALSKGKVGDRTAAPAVSDTAVIHTLEVIATDRLSHTYPWGKQKKRRGGMWYTPVSGIWKSVWLECVPERPIERLVITPKVAESGRGVVEIAVKGGCAPYSLTIESLTRYRMDKAADETIATYGQTISSEDGRFQLDFEKLGIEPHAWTPEEPYLYHFRVESGMDCVTSYFALRTVDVRPVGGHQRICLNGEPIFLHTVLDQGYFPEGIYVPGSPEAYANDVLQLKRLGYNALRKHIKVEPDVFYTNCDRLGMLVMQDMVNSGPYSFLFDTALPTIGKKDRRLVPAISSKKRKNFFYKEMQRTAEELYNHPCIVYYTIFNEGWGEFETGKAYDVLKQADPTRIIDTCSGWFNPEKSDVDSEHIYFRTEKLSAKEKPLVLSEFGGYTRNIPYHVFSKFESYGYGGAESEEELTEMIRKAYEEMVIASIPDGLCGSVYTQISDVEDEINGLMTYDRKVVKVNAKEMLKIAEKIANALKQPENS